MFNFGGYDEKLMAIYETKAEAMEYLKEQANEYNCDDVVDYMKEDDLHLIEWECGSNNYKHVQPSND